MLWHKHFKRYKINFLAHQEIESSYFSRGILNLWQKKKWMTFANDEIGALCDLVKPLFSESQVLSSIVGVLCCWP